ncbi:hypothetical protein BRADI_3g34203v3 [Brachypodium distachyon]|uniref:Uncharacterized protein n=1 Tax=Brachypodium distachyon TaxID=15368 RepID=A0A2K2D103_BRADI|nr:hypothetical protein BRADI_3g34203v3 [Brachypodium distachyon]
MHQPGIEPGSVPWQGTILPLDHWCFVEMASLEPNLFLSGRPATVRAGSCLLRSPLQRKERVGTLDLCLAP